MIKAIKNYFKMKSNEWKVKAKLYGALSSFIDNYSEITNTVTKMYNLLKDLNSDEMKELLVEKIAEIVHNNAQEE